MTENTSMAKKKAESILLGKIDEDKNSNTVLRNKNSNVRKKNGCNLSQHRQKSNVKQKAKQKRIRKFEKIRTKLDIPNMSLTCNEKIYEQQIQRLNLVFKQSLNCPTLTQDELNILFMKYKLDGHYRTNKNLPPFASLIHNTNNTVNGKYHFYDQTQYMPFSDTQKINCKTNKNLYHHSGNENQHTGENLNIFKNVQLSLKHDPWKPKEILKEGIIDNRIDSKYLYVEQNSASDGNYNQIVTNYDMQTCNNANILNDIENYDQSKSSLNIKRNSNIEEGQFPCNLTNAQNSLSEELQSYRYTKALFCNVPDSNVQYESSNNHSKISQQNDIQCKIQYNDLSLNPNCCNNFRSNKWNNNVSSVNKNNFQSWKSTQSIFTPYKDNLESYYHLKNSITPIQLTLIKNHPEEQTNFSSHVHTNLNYLMDNENLSYITNSNSIDVQQNFNNYYISSSTIMSDNFLPETNTFIPPYTNITD